MKDTEWLERLKSGDTVCISDRSDSRFSLGKVKRTTKTMIILESGSRFSKNGGRRVNSGDWDFTRIREYTEEVKERIMKDRLLYNVKNLAPKCLPYLSVEELQQIYDILKAKKDQ